jgi:hypothetical protein
MSSSSNASSLPPRQLVRPARRGGRLPAGAGATTNPFDGAGEERAAVRNGVRGADDEGEEADDDEEDEDGDEGDTEDGGGGYGGLGEGNVTEEIEGGEGDGEGGIEEGE